MMRSNKISDIERAINHWRERQTSDHSEVALVNTFPILKLYQVLFMVLRMREKESHHLGAGVGAGGICVRSADAATGPCTRCTVVDSMLRLNTLCGRQP